MFECSSRLEAGVLTSYADPAVEYTASNYSYTANEQDKQKEVEKKIGRKKG